MNRDSAVLLAFALRHYLYYWVPDVFQGQAWNITTSVLALVVLAALRPAWYIAAWVAAEELLVIGCGLLWSYSQWQLVPGQEQCSANPNIKISAIGLCLLAFVTLRHTVRVSILHPRGRDGK